MCPHGITERSVHCGQKAAGGLVERESSVLPGRVLTESCQTLHVAPDRAWIRLVLLRQRVCLHGLLARQIESLHNRIKHRIARRGIESKEKLGRHRWVIERTLAWLARYRRLTIRYERLPAMHQAFLHIGCALICLNFLE